MYQQNWVYLRLWLNEGDAWCDVISQYVLKMRQGQQYNHKGLLTGTSLHEFG